MRIAVITGASSGLGLEFVKKICNDEQFDQIWIIARRKERLIETEIKYGQKIIPLVLDLTKRDDLQIYRQKLEKENPEVGLLINCAGFGKFGTYEQVSLEGSLNMIDLNCKSVVFMSEITIPYMQKNSKILEVASIAAFQPIPYLNVYAATKSFVLSYTLGLNEELKKTGIKAFALCPGWIKTEFFNNSGNDNGAVTHFNKWFTTDQIVDYAIKAINKGNSCVIIPSIKNKLQAVLVKFFSKKIVMKIWLKQQKHK